MLKVEIVQSFFFDCVQAHFSSSSRSRKVCQKLKVANANGVDKHIRQPVSEIGQSSSGRQNVEISAQPPSNSQ